MTIRSADGADRFLPWERNGYAATIVTRMGRDLRERGSVARSFCRAIERDPSPAKAWAKGAAQIFTRYALTDVTQCDQCRAQGSLRGRYLRLRMGCVEKMPQCHTRGASSFKD